MKVFVVSRAASGEDYENDMPEILGVFFNKPAAEACLKDTVRAEEYEGDEIVDHGDYIEITNDQEDYHMIVRIDEKEVL